MTDHPYLLDNRQAEAQTRFEALAELFNPSTFRHMDALGIASGWRVWEVGAGGPSVPSWIATRTKGYVLATDIDTSRLDENDAAFEIRQHNIGSDPICEGEFDLVHARLVLVHVEERNQALSTMIKALCPGGWLLIEEADPGLQPLVCPDDFGPEQHLANKLKTGFRSLLTERGVDLSFGRTLPRLFKTLGLCDVGSDAFFPMGGKACNDLERATVLQTREQLISKGLASGEEIDQHLANIDTGQLFLATSPMVSAWGKKVA